MDIVVCDVEFICGICVWLDGYGDVECERGVYKKIS